MVPLYSTGAYIQLQWGGKPHQYKGSRDGDGEFLVVLPLREQLLVGYLHNDEEGKGDERGQEGVPVGLVVVDQHARLVPDLCNRIGVSAVNSAPQSKG